MTEILVDEDAWERAGEPQRKKLRWHAERLQETPFRGERIQRTLIPERFSHLPNLFRLELPGAWRALYTVATSPTRGQRIRVVWVGDHTAYDRLFGYS